ncbi:MAG: hypothetical protein HOC09_35270 [Deltaproteobacteria bacterium]|jgi:hypothetical protein|nr:hypothetical protein [Deltaproteobacteria bacterium]
MESYIDKIENSDFECEAGPLKMSLDWVMLKKLSDLWIVVKNDENICHTSGNDGYRFTVATNQKEAEWLANLYNKERYGGEKICFAKRLLAVES